MLGSERTKLRLLELLKRQGGQTMQQLATKLSLTVPGARRHLLNLEEEGLAQSRIEKPKGRGRPQKVYLLTDKGEALFPKTYARLCAELLRGVRTVYGPHAVEKVLQARNAELSAKFRSRCSPEETLEVQLQQLAEWLSETCFDAYIEHADNVWYLTERNCPHLEVAQQFPQVCVSECKLFQSLLPNCDVRREAHMACGQLECRYRIEFRV